MYKELSEHIHKAIERSLTWARQGWEVSFGRRKTLVSSRQEAEELPPDFVYREEALDYWSNIEQLGREAAAWGRKAMASLAENDLEAAENAIYQALYLERPCEHYSMTWRGVHESILKTLGR